MRDVRSILGAVVLAAMLLSQVGCLGTFGMDDLHEEGVFGAQMGLEPQIELTFPQTPEGMTSENELVITSTGDASLALESVFIEGLDADVFAVPSLPLPMMLPAGASMPIRISFEPYAEGQFRAKVTVSTRNEQSMTVTREVLGQACRDWDADHVCDYGGPPLDTGDTGW